MPGVNSVTNIHRPVSPPPPTLDPKAMVKDVKPRGEILFRPIPEETSSKLETRKVVVVEEEEYQDALDNAWDDEEEFVDAQEDEEVLKENAVKLFFEVANKNLANPATLTPAAAKSIRSGLETIRQGMLADEEEFVDASEDEEFQKEKAVKLFFELANENLANPATLTPAAAKSIRSGLEIIRQGMLAAEEARVKLADNPQAQSEKIKETLAADKEAKADIAVPKRIKLSWVEPKPNVFVRTIKKIVNVVKNFFSRLVSGPDVESTVLNQRETVDREIEVTAKKVAKFASQAIREKVFHVLPSFLARAGAYVIEKIIRSNFGLTPMLNNIARVLRQNLFDDPAKARKKFENAVAGTVGALGDQLANLNRAYDRLAPIENLPIAQKENRILDDLEKEGHLHPAIAKLTIHEAQLLHKKPLLLEQGVDIEIEIENIEKQLALMARDDQEFNNLSGRLQTLKELKAVEDRVKDAKVAHLSKLSAAIVDKLFYPNGLPSVLELASKTGLVNVREMLIKVLNNLLIAAIDNASDPKNLYSAILKQVQKIQAAQVKPECQKLKNVILRKLEEFKKTDNSPQSDEDLPKVDFDHIESWDAPIEYSGLVNKEMQDALGKVLAEVIGLGFPTISAGLKLAQGALNISLGVFSEIISSFAGPLFDYTAKQLGVGTSEIDGDLANDVRAVLLTKMSPAISAMEKDALDQLADGDHLILDGLHAVNNFIDKPAPPPEEAKPAGNPIDTAAARKELKTNLKHIKVPCVSSIPFVGERIAQGIGNGMSEAVDRIEMKRVNQNIIFNVLDAFVDSLGK